MAQAHVVSSPSLLGCSQVVRQLFLVQCTVGSNPTIPASLAQNTVSKINRGRFTTGRLGLPIEPAQVFQ